MYRTAISVIGASLLLPLQLTAQTVPMIAPGDTVQFRTDRKDPLERGTVVALRDGQLVVSADTGIVTVPIASIATLEVRRPHQFDGRGALIGSGIGGVIGVLGSAASPVREKNVLAAAAFYGVHGAVLGGGGRKARRAGRTGSFIGVVPGALIGLVGAEHCGMGGAWQCVAFYGFAGGAFGGMVGSWIGALTPGQVWVDVRPTRLLTTAQDASREPGGSPHSRLGLNVGFVLTHR